MKGNAENRRCPFLNSTLLAVCVVQIKPKKMLKYIEDFSKKAKTQQNFNISMI
jgi:hypothetical protein